MKKKLLCFCPELGGGGAERHLTRLLNALDSDRFEIILITSSSGGAYEAELNKGKIKHISLGLSKKSATKRLFQSVLPLSKYLTELQPDIFFTIMHHANFAGYLAHRKAKSNARFICSVQNSIYQALEFEFRKMLYLYSKVIPFVYSYADLVIVLSDGVKKELHEKIKKNMNSLTIHNIGIEKSKTSQNKKVLEPIISVCGRLVKLKGFDIVIRALEIIKKEIHDVKLNIIGEGPERRNLKELAQNLGLKENVNFTGFIDNPEEIISSSRVFILSSYHEGFGNVIIEAMSQGVPVVSTNCPYGPGEIITDNLNGLLVPMNNAGHMAAAVLKILKGNELYFKLKKNGLERANDFTPQAIAKKYSKTFLNDLNEQV